MPSGHLDFYINELEEKIKFQHQEAKSPLNKASMMVGFIPIIIGIILSLRHFEMIIDKPCLIFGTYLLFISLGLSFILAFIPIFKFRRDPEPNYFINQFFKNNISLGNTKRWLLTRLLDSYNDNKKLLEIEQFILIIAAIFLLFGLIHLFISLWN